MPRFNKNHDDRDIRPATVTSHDRKEAPVKNHDVPSWVAHVLTPPEVIAAYVERRVNDPALLSGEQHEPTYADFLRAE
ncbi:hypothetical protein BIU90_15010 [Curtobacterium sp. MCBA15_001]|nr:hypothetical protein BIU90_15010 [Curtobacterium sp. MCBA15_001]